MRHSAHKKDAYLKYTGTIRSPPCIQQVVFARADEPLSTGGKF